MHPAIRIFGAFFLAIALASGVLYAIDRSRNDGSNQHPESPAKTADAAPFAANPASSTAAAATLAAGDPPQPPAPAAGASRPLLENVGVIAKCTIDGRIVYTDKGCPQGSKAKPVQITDNAIIPGVDQATIERTLRQPPPQLAQAPAAAVIEPAITTVTTEAGVDCLALGRRLEWLNYAGHRRQPPHIRDRMQRERDDLQTRRFWAHC
ncbi:MAG: hypothetical protein NVS3B11_04140 [Collimonas sp.]